MAINKLSRRIWPAAVLVVGLILASFPAGTADSRPIPDPADRPPIRLVLFVVVDQLRADLLARFHDRFGPGGFRRLMDGGTWFEDARCDHFPTLTSVGHAAIFTGAAVPDHGIAGNDWAAGAAGGRMYSLEDPVHTILGRKPKRHEGSSPRNLDASTIGDEMVAADNHSRVFAVSWKDRAAILAAGREGKAFWFASDTGEFVSSTYYFHSAPDWMTRWNVSRPAHRYKGAVWEYDREAVTGTDDRPEEKGHKLLGRSFPHRLPEEISPDFHDVLGTTPFGDELTADFATALLDAEKLGQGPAPDLLVLGLTCTDFIGHAFGPSSLEYRDQVWRLDRLLAGFFAEVDRRIGLDRTLIVLTSDHGVDEIPEINSAAGKDAGRLNPEEIRSRLNAGLRARFNIGFDPVDAFWTPAFHINEAGVARAGLALDCVEEAAAELLRAEAGVAWALPRSALLSGRVPNVPLLDSVRRSVHPRRTGHLIVVQKPFWYLYEDAMKYSAMHGSPYAYDTRVPLGFAGPGISARRRIDPASLNDIAATLAVLLGTAAPSCSIGRPLLDPPGRKLPR